METTLRPNSFTIKKPVNVKGYIRKSSDIVLDYVAEKVNTNVKVKVKPVKPVREMMLTWIYMIIFLTMFIGSYCDDVFQFPSFHNARRYFVNSFSILLIGKLTFCK
jgi:hypothetical protein